LLSLEKFALNWDFLAMAGDGEILKRKEKK